MQTKHDPFDRRHSDGHSSNEDDLDLDRRGPPRRGQRRLPIRLWTEGRHGEALDFHNCSNLSETGIFIENPDPYPLGARVHIDFNLPGVDDPISVVGVAVSVLDEQSAGAAIMGNGFQFERIGARDAALVRSFVQASGT